MNGHPSPAAEGRGSWREPPERGLRAWRTFVAAHARIRRLLDEELQSRHGLSLAEFEALAALAEAPAGRLRMNQVADQVLLSRSGVTRLIDRLESEGLVERLRCPTDARGAEARLTPRGAQRLGEAAETHRAGVARYFAAILSPAELAALETSLGRLEAQLALAVVRRGSPPARGEDDGGNA